MADPASWRLAMRRRNTQKVSHLLAADLRRQILSGEIAAGHQLPPEAELTAAWRVSRDTLREALRILESQSLLEVRLGRGGGAVVRRPGLDAVSRYVALLLQLRATTLAQLQEARSVIEPPCAELVAGHAGPEELERLVALHHAECEVEGDPLSFVAAVGEFDQAVTELAGNRTLSVVTGVFRDIYEGHAYSAIGSTDPGDAGRIARRVVASQRAFLEAVRMHDGPLAATAWSEYLTTISRMLGSRSRQPIDMTPLWRARAAKASSGPAPRRAIAVAGEVRARIAEGRLQEGDRLGSLAELATEFDISRPTLREALRVLEMELLLDLRTGDRSGATIRTPTTQVAAQLAGIVLEARQTTLADFHHALRLVEPAIVELVVSRVDRSTLGRLQDMAAQLGACVEDTGRFVTTWEAAAAELFSATKNPALSITAEILHWVRVGIHPAVTSRATALPWVAKTNRKAHARFTELVDAVAQRDPARARDAWAACQDITGPFLESTELGERLMVDLLG